MERAESRGGAQRWTPVLVRMLFLFSIRWEGKEEFFLFRTKHKLPAHGRVGDSILEPFSLPHDAVSASRAPRRVALLPRAIPSSPMASIF